MSQECSALGFHEHEHENEHENEQQVISLWWLALQVSEKEHASTSLFWLLAVVWEAVIDQTEKKRGNSTKPHF